ncbi:MAG TPA: MTAP family purine nucleoside phosphorylase [Jatrophihabitantaceae bacterium]|nr:MTAP family purine nucleoside phosphorylase [Jatrophihabitantaceae bacterium]
MRVGIISGSGSHDWPRLAAPDPRTCRTAYGSVELTFGSVSGVQVVHLSRHGAGHARLSNHVSHKANLTALLDAKVDCVISLTVCGAVDPQVELGSLIAFDDLYFPSNRLADGTLCTWHDAPGLTGRGHWIFDAPFSESLRETLVGAARDVGASVRDGGCYGQVDGPRFNSRAEIAALRAAGIAAVSQTAGPEVVLAGEAQLPLSVLGYVTDHANGVAPPQPVTQLLELMAASTETFARVLEAALPQIDKPDVPGLVHRFTP